ncbi:hypothetical protein M408DRAFT_24004 [Serendipita vermifera MAFF 305830]|uniref:Uncharacterized protein n=1 Tax=Serendipita vermifera MAFF 305830 TaxID=933852 RepID=A0A0C2XFU3_SERVB|nr:hypothetical protein M408DRAFT_24004 [Serendipita vermifera MAFF 305830]
MLSKLQKQKSPPGGPSPSPPPTSPDNTTAAARSERQYEILRDGSIVFFATVKDVSEATEVLAPLKATCGLLVRALEMTKSINDNKKNLLEFQRTLGIHLNFFVTYKPKDGRTHDLVERATQPYKTELEAICEEVSKEADRMKPGFTAVMKRIGRSRIDVDQQKTWNDRLNAAHKTLTTAFQITISSQLGDISQDVKAIGKDIKSISASRPANFARDYFTGGTLMGVTLEHEQKF